MKQQLDISESELDLAQNEKRSFRDECSAKDEELTVEFWCTKQVNGSFRIFQNKSPHFKHGCVSQKRPKVDRWRSPLSKVFLKLKHLPLWDYNLLVSRAYSTITLYLFR